MISGKKVVDIAELIDVFQAQEGEIQSFSGGIGQGKTYGATKRAINDLLSGKVVYTNWHLILDEFNGDQRKSFAHAFWHWLFFRKRFYDIDIKKNWHFFDMDSSNTWEIKGQYYDNLVDFIANLTDCVVYLDEGQDIFDSYEGTKMSKKKRKSITRTRHLRKTLVVISQRPQAIAVTARANVNTFYKHYKTMTFPWVHFKVYATEEIDAQNMPQFDLEARPYETYFASKKILNCYNSWYLRGGIPKSQEVFFDAYDLTSKERFALFLSFLPRFRLKPKTSRNEDKSLGDNAIITTIKNNTSYALGIITRTLSFFKQKSPVRLMKNGGVRVGSIQRIVGEKQKGVIHNQLPL